MASAKQAIMRHMERNIDEAIEVWRQEYHDTEIYTVYEFVDNVVIAGSYSITEAFFEGAAMQYGERVPIDEADYLYYDGYSWKPIPDASDVWPLIKDDIEAMIPAIMKCKYQISRGL